MVLNFIWIGFFLVSFVVALVRLVFLHDTEIFTTMVNSTFEMAATSGGHLPGPHRGAHSLAGPHEGGGAGRRRPGAWPGCAALLPASSSRRFPGTIRSHGSIIMNFAANMLGLDNAATPLGLKAMQELQELNPDPETASNAQIMFLVLNTSGSHGHPHQHHGLPGPDGGRQPFGHLPSHSPHHLLLHPRGASSRWPWFSGSTSWTGPVLAYLLGLTGVVGGTIVYFSSLPQEQVETVSNVIANVILFGIIVGFITLAMIRRVNVYDAFIDGAKEGFAVVIKIIPYLVAILVGIGVFRASGAMDYLVAVIGKGVGAMGLNTDFIEALPTALMKPLSGSGARGMMVDAMQTYGADSFVGRLASTFQGATDTTFYIIALYFGSVGVKQTRHAVPCGLFADLVSVVAGIFIAYLFFH